MLRAEVQLSESREAFLNAREAELDAVARLNNVMGRNAALPLEVNDVATSTAVPPALVECLERAAAERPEVGWARQAVAAAGAGREAARADFLPRISARSSAGHVDGTNVRTGWQEGAGLHVEVPVFAGGRRGGELRSAEADVAAAVADAQTVLDGVSLEVSLAHRGVLTARQRIELVQTAVEQAVENLRLVRVKSRNGTATPTDVVDAETALTRAQQRDARAAYAHLAALACLSYAMGLPQPAFGAAPGPDALPAPRPLP